MDLNFVQSDIDLASVKPIDVKELIGAVNEYLLRMSDMLNAFATSMENGVLNLDRRLDRVEIQMILLEKKLENVSDSQPALQPIQPSVQIDQLKVTEPVATIGREDGPEAISLQESRVDDVEQPNLVEDVLASGLVKARDHENYVKYFKMLKMGVPEPAVRQKMQAEGLDPNILNEPEKMIPMNKPSEQSDKDSSDSNNASFSDSDC
uniref:Uncharacterized protein n=1 Tax=Ditylenchus dipsaci TaxID=166011 RepID=A0A915CMQ8_9BILA